MSDILRYEWLIADAYLPAAGEGPPYGHEAICLLNASDDEARIVLDLYFEDREPVRELEFWLRAERTLHLRTDRFSDHVRVDVPREVPYAIRVRSSVALGVQYSRLDVTQPNYSLMTTFVPPVG